MVKFQTIVLEPRVEEARHGVEIILVGLIRSPGFRWSSRQTRECPGRNDENANNEDQTNDPCHVKGSKVNNGVRRKLEMWHNRVDVVALLDWRHLCEMFRELIRVLTCPFHSRTGHFPTHHFLNV